MYQDLLYCYVLMDPLVAVGRKSPQNSMWLPAIPVPYGYGSPALDEDKR